MKSKIDELDIEKLETTPVDLSKLSDVVKNYVVKKAKYNELVKKLTNIKTTDTSDLVKKKTNYNTKINETENKINDHDYAKFITTQELNRSTSDHFTARLAQAKLESKNDIAYFVEETDSVDKIKNFI